MIRKCENCKYWNRDGWHNLPDGVGVCAVRSTTSGVGVSSEGYYCDKWYPKDMRDLDPDCDNWLPDWEDDKDWY